MSNREVELGAQLQEWASEGLRTPDHIADGNDSSVFWDGEYPGWVYRFYRSILSRADITSYLALYEQVGAFLRQMEIVAVGEHWNLSARVAPGAEIIEERVKWAEPWNSNAMRWVTRQAYIPGPNASLIEENGKEGFVWRHLPWKEKVNGLDFLADFPTEQEIYKSLLAPINRKLVGEFGANVELVPVNVKFRFPSVYQVELVVTDVCSSIVTWVRTKDEPRWRRR